MNQATAYNEQYRPQFHFSARKNWLNDPNGCVFHDGAYHLFFQHNPAGREWGNMTWGHAVSPDLMHWRQLPNAILPYGDGTIYSGSAVADWENRSGFGQGHEGPLVAAFTHARKPFGQAIAFSNDKGLTWELYDNGRHVVPNQGLDDGERDPRIFWHAPSRKWIMVLWVQKGCVRFFTSDNLKQWAHASDFAGEGFYECPDLFELPVDSDAQDSRWILNDAAFNYWIGSFDGTGFRASAGPLQGDWGGNFYAAQTWNNTGGRIFQIGWMRGGQYPGMPFNQQMSFPCELTLRSTDNGIRLCRAPITPISNLYVGTVEFKDTSLCPGGMLDTEQQGDLFDIEADVEMKPDTIFSLRVRDQVITFGRGQVACLGKVAPLASRGNGVVIRLIVDRTSIELFINRGEAAMSGCFVPERETAPIQCRADGGAVYVRSLLIHKLHTVWDGDIS